MKNWFFWVSTTTVLAMSPTLVFAADESMPSGEQAIAAPSATSSTSSPTATESNVAASAETAVASGSTATAPAAEPDAARSALKQKNSDASSEKNLEEVFQAAERTYSLLKKGKFALQYGVDYSYYRNSRIDIALAADSSTITRFKIEEDAQHTFGNDIELSYGIRDNLTFTTNLPLVAKFETQQGLSTTGLGDINFGLRWQPVPIRRGVPSTTLFANLSTATGDSPYEINRNEDLSTGKGFYSLTGGISANKVADPVVLFGSANYSISSRVSGLDQPSGNRRLKTFTPGDSIGASMGFAYALNYDVSITASYQQSFSFSSKLAFSDNTTFRTAAQTSGSISFSLGLRTDPKRILNLSLGYGLTDDTPDITLGFSLPIDFAGAESE